MSHAAALAVLGAAFLIGGFLMCVGAVTCVRWVRRRLTPTTRPDYLYEPEPDPPVTPAAAQRAA